jgi:NADH:ubiquinone oxidoreductase subunit 6 (subunit J)
MFRFNYYSLTNATRKAAYALLALGLFLLGLGILVIVLRAVFVIIAAVLIFMAALWCIAIAVKMFVHICGSAPKDNCPHNAYRKNVRIHHDSDSEY